MRRLSIVRVAQVTGIVLVSLAICGWLAWEFVLYPNLYKFFGDRQILERDIAMWTTPINVPREGLEELNFSYRKLRKTRGLRWQPISWQVARSKFGGAGLFYDPADVLGIARPDAIVVELLDIPPQVDANRFERGQRP